jgi:uncharacterized protein YabN with tetrapyrrole methylase and pyrophosphatase domain
LFPGDATAIWRRADGAAESVRWEDVPQMALGPSDALDLPGVPVAAGPLLYVMERLLGPDGCPWDRQQTSASLIHYLLDESYEAAEALWANDATGFLDELGDVLLQVVFHAKIFPGSSFDEVVRHQSQKLIRRHPHVFGDHKESSAEAVRGQWERLKAQEPPRTRQAQWVYPALVAARRASQRGVKPTSAVFEAIFRQVEVYVAESPGKIEEILADAAWAVAESGRIHHHDAEWALWSEVAKRTPSR